MGDSHPTQNIQINIVIGENENSVFYFTEKTKWAFWPTQYMKTTEQEDRHSHLFCKLS